MKSVKLIKPNDPMLQYMGRIDWDDPENPIWVYVCTCVRVRFTGTSIAARITNHRLCWDNFLGVIVDGVQSCVKLDDAGTRDYVLAEGLPDTEHELLLFKRQDACHYLTFHGLLIEADAQISAPAPLPQRKIEVYGDSVSAGEVSEAVAYCGQVDPPHNGEFSNGYYSYAWFTARMLGAQLHDIAQGGIALLDDTGYFHAPDYRGMENCFDKLEYNDQIAPNKPWDFARFTPHVVIVAIGQNDPHPDDYMSADPHGEKVENWKRHYADWLTKLRRIYPNARIVLTMTILNHNPDWDAAIEQVCRALNDPKITHFLYSKNGCGTHGHIRIPEAEQMGRELSAYIDALPQVWEDNT